MEPQIFEEGGELSALLSNPTVIALLGNAILPSNAVPKPPDSALHKGLSKTKQFFGDKLDILKKKTGASSFSSTKALPGSNTASLAVLANTATFFKYLLTDLVKRPSGVDALPADPLGYAGNLLTAVEEFEELVQLVVYSCAEPERQSRSAKGAFSVDGMRQAAQDAATKAVVDQALQGQSDEMKQMAQQGIALKGSLCIRAGSRGNPRKLGSVPTAPSGGLWTQT